MEIQKDTETENRAERDKRGEALRKAIKNRQSDIRRDKFDFSYSELVSMYERGELIIYPDFQRYFRWDIERRTKFLESLIVGIPTPPVFVVADTKSDKIEWVVIDGLQRLTTVISFMGELREEDIVRDNDEESDEESQFGNNWELTAGTLLPELEGFTFGTLPPDVQFHIRRAYCRVELMLPGGDGVDYRFELFARLNTGGATLTEQEVRNAIYRGTFDQIFDFMNRLSEQEDFLVLTKDLKQDKRRQLYGQELVLRYAMLSERYVGLTQSLTSELNIFLEQVINKQELPDSLTSRFERVCRLLVKTSGEDTFRLSVRRFVSSIYDAIMIAVDTHLEHYEDADPELLKVRLEEFKKAYKDTKLSSYGTSSPTAVRTRITMALKFLDPKIPLQS